MAALCVARFRRLRPRRKAAIAGRRLGPGAGRARRAELERAEPSRSIARACFAARQGDLSELLCDLVSAVQPRGAGDRRAAAASTAGAACRSSAWTSSRTRARQRFFRTEHHLSYPVVIDAGTLRDQYDVNGLPVHVFIDRGGVVRKIVVGELVAGGHAQQRRAASCGRSGDSARRLYGVPPRL